MSEQRVALVTGASRGAGKGVALGLASRGYTVYVSGRSQVEGDAALPGSIHQTAHEIDTAGGRGIAVRCDHARDADVAALMERSGQTLIGAELGAHYAIRDRNGRQPPSYRASLGDPLRFSSAIVQ